MDPQSFVLIDNVDTEIYKFVNDATEAILIDPARKTVNKIVLTNYQGFNEDDMVMENPINTISDERTGQTPAADTPASDYHESPRKLNPPALNLQFAMRD